ncbi:NYN domain-containing protein [uncultured Clostridium sp.]|uniref:NYN domain-containing protein n=1 Tax=uncultured Clostridium sp. TaxID=59620 RepID=UPI0025EB6A33|nr:NYN domain-containing protein [uncultured Clostridium sp.]
MEEKRFAILIDAENVSAKYIEYILDEISNYGIATYKRIYADWTKTNNSMWKDVLLKKSLTPIQQYAYTTGKNSTDSALIIDAMDILYSNNVEGFCIVSSDSDFTRLAARLRESGMTVIGMGEEKTPEPFVHACNQFKYLDVLVKSDKNNILYNENSDLEKVATADGSEDKNQHIVIKKNEEKKKKTMTSINTIKKAIFKIINENSDSDLAMNMGELGSRLTKRYPDFDSRNYGYSKFSKLLAHIDNLIINGQKVCIYEPRTERNVIINDEGLKNSIIKIINENNGKIELGNIHKKLVEVSGRDYMKNSKYNRPGKFFKSLDFVNIEVSENNTKNVVLNNKKNIKEKEILK